MRIAKTIVRDLWVVLLSASIAASPAYAANSDLPDIGSPADAVLSKEKEQQIGRSIYRSLRDTDSIVSDPEIQEYIQDVGQKLAANAQDGDFRFRFFVVDDPAINAFALPGGYIGVHSGLILTASEESELAGVLAHEVAHVTQRHISRAIFANQRASILTMAAMLGAILVGAATGSGDAVTGAIATAQGVAVQQQINFTRGNEYEADRVGIAILADAGFDPQGMPSFFETLARKSGPLASRAPEFLRTHPVTVNRIAETRARARDYPVADNTDALGFTLTRARLKLLGSRTPEAALEYFLGERENPDKAGKLGVEYGIALSYLELGRVAAAREAFETLLASNESVIHFHTALAATQLAQNDRNGAFATYEHAMRLFPRNLPLTVRYAEALMQDNQAEKAHAVLLDLYNQVPPTPDQVRQIALAASAAGDIADAHHYMAEYHILIGDLTMAADQLRLALALPNLDDVQVARFRSRLDEIQEYIPGPDDRRQTKRDKGN